MAVKISIIIPVYNTSKYLSECLDSVLAQDLVDIEAICINDGSTDNSLEILRKYEAKDARVVVIDKPNEGVGAARNDGIRKAQGEFLAFMDSDDFYPDNAVLGKLYNAALEHDVRVSCGHYYAVNPDGTRKERRFSYKKLSFKHKGLCEYRDFQFDFGYWCYIFSTQMIRDNKLEFPKYGRFQDPPFFVRAMATAGTFYALNEPTYCYRYFPAGNKFSIAKTIDAIKGMADNISFAREHDFARLHYISACRLNEEGSFMAERNLGDKRTPELMAQMMRAVSLVDVDWLRKEHFDISEDFVPNVFKYMAESTVKYEKLRANPFFRFVRKLIGK